MMSGGVDSSAAALILKREGWNVVGVTLRIPFARGCEEKRSCCGMEAAYTCRSIGVPHYFVDMREEFEQLVIEPFRRWYRDGKTPSPCIDCNSRIKFELAFDLLTSELIVDRVATGHYARVVEQGGRHYLARAHHKTKDQSYFLYGITIDRLPRLLFPLGDKTKTLARKITAAAGLSVARRTESMELCFVGEGDYRKAIDVKEVPGDILNESGFVVGRHTGIAHYTIGQRKGIGIAAKEPLFVSAIDPVANTITVAPRSALETDTVGAVEPNVMIPERLVESEVLFGKIRSQGEPAECIVTEAAADRFAVRFKVAVFAPTPGQRLVLYDEKDRVVAGGIICSPPISRSL
jgi:tRNA-specific 2-thiouridylase